jgi:hypothetical protein
MQKQLLAAAIIASTGLYAANASAADPQIEQLRQQLQQQQQQLQATAAALDELRDQVEEGGEETLQWEGYATFNYTQYDFFKNVQDTTADRRTKVDMERLVLEPKFRLSNNIEFEAELEIEHGGTGSSVEYEADEFGEYELELEKGGEVVVEKAQLEIYSSPAVNWRLGHIVVPFGMANRYTHPTDYFTTTRSQAETALIPNTWHETGAELHGRAGPFKYSALVVNGLDSSGFSSQNWVASGYQTRMEFANADDLAFVGVLDYPLGGKSLVGGAWYSGNSANNRHQQNLNASTNVSIWELHARYQRGPLTLRGQLMAGTVENSDLITDANKNLVSQDIRGVSATPVGHAAQAMYVEAGYDLFHLFGSRHEGRLDLFVRLDDFDTMAAVEGSIVDNPRYDRNIATVGINYKPSAIVVYKAEYAQHRHAGTVANQSQQFALGLGVIF